MKLLMAAAGTALLALPSPAQERQAGNDAEAVRVMHGFAGCVVAERGGEARRILAMDFRTDVYRRRLRQLADVSNDCLGRGRLRFSGLLLAGGMAEHLFLRDHGGVDSIRLAATADPDPRSRSEAMSYCVVRHAPLQARAVLGTPVASDAESAALDALRPAVSACLADGEEAQLNRPGLRALVALALHHFAGARTAPGNGLENSE